MTTASPHTAAAQFHRWQGRDPELLAAAPGRINLIGEHVDYQGGLVLPAAINLGVYAAATRLEAAVLRLHSSFRSTEAVEIPLDALHRRDGATGWANYPLGVVACYHHAGYKTGGMAIAFDASLPVGAGLSSSAAFEAATAVIIEQALGISLPARDRALLCQQAEHDYAGVPCGIMDQFAVNAGQAGHALLLDCRSLEVCPTPLPADVAMVVVDSRVKHALADGEYGKRRADCEKAARLLDVVCLRDATPEMVESSREALGERVVRRARHVVSEIDRTRQFAAALAAGKLEEAGRLMAASHASLRDDFEVSCRELDTLVAIANSLGITGSRMMGGGFGGSTIQLVPAADAPEIAAAIEKAASGRGLHVSAFPVTTAAAAAPVAL
jgi:galactokinase